MQGREDKLGGGGGGESRGAQSVLRSVYSYVCEGVYFTGEMKLGVWAMHALCN